MNGPIRAIFSVAVLAMWVLFALALGRGEWPATLWAVLIASHLACAIVFYNFAFVFSYGYAVSVVVANLLIVARHPSIAAALVAFACIAYGLRLWQFVHARHRDASYREVLARTDEAGRRTPFALRAIMWVLVSWLMAFHALTNWNVAMHARITPWLLAGFVVMLAGLVLESVADAQKLAAKRLDPQRWVGTGLYQRMRHPNYLGEIIFQSGLMLAGLGSAPDLLWLAAALIAPLYIVVLMHYAAEDLERRQLARYGTDPAFQAWHASTGRLSPAGSRAVPR